MEIGQSYTSCLAIWFFFFSFSFFEHCGLPSKFFLTVFPCARVPAHSHAVPRGWASRLCPGPSSGDRRGEPAFHRGWWYWDQKDHLAEGTYWEQPVAARAPSPSTRRGWLGLCQNQGLAGERWLQGKQEPSHHPSRERKPSPGYPRPRDGQISYRTQPGQSWSFREDVGMVCVL